MYLYSYTVLLWCNALTCTRREQELSNYLQQKDYVRAVGVAINLDQPFRVFTILSGLLYTTYKLDVESRKLRALESRRGPGL